MLIINSLHLSSDIAPPLLFIMEWLVVYGLIRTMARTSAFGVVDSGSILESDDTKNF